MSSRHPHWQWRQIWWPGRFDPDLGLELLDRICADHNLGPVVLEARSHNARVSYFVGAHRSHVKKVDGLIQALVPGARLSASTRTSSASHDSLGQAPSQGTLSSWAAGRPSAPSRWTKRTNAVPGGVSTCQTSVASTALPGAACAGRSASRV